MKSKLLKLAIRTTITITPWVIGSVIGIPIGYSLVLMYYTNKVLLFALIGAVALYIWMMFCWINKDKLGSD